MTPIIVVGMHRSGTSAVTRVLDLLGVDLGPEDQLLEAKEDNPEGFWENRHLVQIHDDLIARMGGRWDDPPLLDQLTAIDDYDHWVERCAAVVEAFEGERPGFKDPRASLLLPLWDSVWPKAQVVVSLRHPKAVALSLRKREDFDEEKSARLWLRYTFEALSAARDPVVVRFEDLLRDTAATIRSVASSIGLEPSDEQFTRAEASIRGESSADPATVDSPESPVMDEAIWLYEHVHQLPRFLHPVVAGGIREPLTRERISTSETKLRKTQGDFRDVRAEADQLGLLADSRLKALEREERSREALATDLAAAKRELDALRKEVGWRRAIQYRFEKVLGRKGLRMLSGYKGD